MRDGLFAVAALALVACGQSDVAVPGRPIELPSNPAVVDMRPAAPSGAAARYCTADASAAARLIVVEIDRAGHEALVIPDLWAAADRALRRDIAAWLSLCEMDGGSVEILHAKTRKRLAGWSKSGVYDELE